MNFSDEYEYELDGFTYYVSVSGQMRNIEGHIVPDLDFIQIYDDMGELVDVGHDHYEIIYQDALDREYELELHTTDFDYYDIA